MSTSTELPDRIERETVIGAPSARVWELITEPGWWINDGEITAHRIEPAGPDRVIVHDPIHGAFAVEKADERSGEYVAFRWYCGPSPERRIGDLTGTTSTLIEFFLTAVDSETTRLLVIESGFSSLDEDAIRRRQMVDENSAGWTEELAALRRHVEAASR